MDELINEIKNLKFQLNILSDKLDKLSKNNLSNKNKKWSFKEEELLIDELKNSININIISKSHGRTKFAIECRIKKIIINRLNNNSLENICNELNLDLKYILKILEINLK
tara:strand:+ start:227 stop:556 length:330 start_codon:yes stop_codon:yes gene_type:complete